MSRIASILASLLLLAGCYSAEQLQDMGVGGPGGDSPSDPADPATPGDTDGDQPNDGQVTDDYDWDSVAEPGLAEGAHVLAEAACVESVESSHEDLDVFIHIVCDPNLQVGDVIVGSENGGYLRELLSFQEYDGLIVAQTAQATLAQVMTEGGFDQVLPWDDEEREVWDFAGTELYSGTVNGADVTVTLSRGLVRFNPELRLSAEFGWLSVKRGEARMDVDFEMDAEVTVTVSGAFEMDGEVPLGSFSKPFTFMAGPVPVAGEIEIELAAGWSVGAEGSVSASAGVEVVADAHLKGIYDRGDWGYTESKRFEAEPRGPDLGIEASFESRLTLKTHAKLMLYGVAGPDFDIDPYARVEAELQCADIPWELHGGIDLGVGLNLDVYFWETNKDFGPWNWETKVADGTIDLPSGIGLGEDCGECAPSGTISCGQIISGNTATDPAASTSMPGYDINVGNYAAPELVYEWSGGGGGEVEFRFIDPVPTEVNHDIMILDGSSGTCHGANSVAWGFNSLVFTPEGSGPFYIVVDGYDGDAGAFQLELNCNPG